MDTTNEQEMSDKLQKLRNLEEQLAETKQALARVSGQLSLSLEISQMEQELRLRQLRIALTDWDAARDAVEADEQARREFTKARLELTQRALAAEEKVADGAQRTAAAFERLAKAAEDGISLLGSKLNQWSFGAR